MRKTDKELMSETRNRNRESFEELWARRARGLAYLSNRVADATGYYERLARAVREASDAIAVFEAKYM